MGIENTEKFARTWERERRFPEASLKAFKETDLHRAIDTNSDDFQRVFSLAMKQLDNLSYDPADPDTIFVKINVDSMDGDDYDTLKQKEGFIGYGISHQQLGFCKGTKFVVNVRPLTIYNDERLSVFVPVPVTENMRRTTTE